MKNCKRFLLPFTLLALISCNPIYYQDPKAWNLDGIENSIIYSEVNPEPIDLKESEVNAIKVAVIDSGFNYNHKFLKAKMSSKYNAESGKTELEGYDFLGNDRLPYPYEIDFSFFHLASDSQIESRNLFSINPFKQLHQWNNHFIDELISKIKNDKNLKNTFFATKIDKDSINIFGLYNLLISNSIQTHKKKIRHLWPDKPDSEENQREENLKLSPLSKMDDIKKDYPDMKQRHLDNLINLRWYADREGLPSTGILIENRNLDLDDLKGAYYFYEHVKSILFSHEFKATQSYIENYALFLTNKKRSKKNPILWVMLNLDLKNALTTIGGKFNKVIYPTRFYGPYQSDFAFEIQEKCVKSQELTQGTKILKEKVIEKIKKLKFVNYAIEDIFAIEDIDCNKEYYIEDNAAYSEPLITEFNNEHGTHVSGIIANQFEQSDNIKIAPVKVPLGSILYPKSMKKETIKYYKKETEEFLDKYSDYYLNSPTFSRKEFLKKYHKTFDRYIAPGRQKIIQAIEWVKNNNIAVANLSLGANYSQGNINQLVEQSQADLSKELKFKLANFFIEFNKLLFRKEIKKAKNTVFFIASGNDGKIVDGVNTHGLPCDLSSSPILRKFGFSLPDSSPSNLICVQSLTKEFTFKDKCSSLSSNFSNKTYSKTKTISVLGENVLSSTHGYGHQILNRLFQKFVTYEKRVKNQAGQTFSEEEEKSIGIAGLIKNLNIENNTSIQKVPFSFFSGTSMATPFATGFFAKEFHDYKKNHIHSITPIEFLQVFTDPKNNYLYSASDNCKEDLRVRENKLKKISLKNVLEKDSVQEKLYHRIQDLK